MKYSIIFLLILFAFVACEEDEPEACDILPEPFRFVIVDSSGDNQLSDDVRPDNTRIFFLEGGGEISLELNFEGTSEDTYGASLILSLRSARGGVETFFIERGDVIDTLFVRMPRQEPGNDCSEYIFDAVTFNGVSATVDTIAEVPVFVLVE